MNRLLRISFLALSALLFLYAILFANYLHFVSSPIPQSKSFWLSLLAAGFFAFGAFRFSLNAKSKIFALILGIMLIEGFLQVVGWMGILPMVNTKEKIPYGRVYWTGEGRGNSIRNRYGWHFPEFDLAASNRVAVIGDSFVDAVEVGRNQNEAAVLNQMLHAQSPDWAAMGFGNHGTGPAQHIQVLDYVQRHFSPREAIVILYLGNDVADCLAELAYDPRPGYIFYDLKNGQLSLSPQNEKNRQIYISALELPHQPLILNLPPLLRSHCMTLQLAISIRNQLHLNRDLKRLAATRPDLYELGKIGIVTGPFEVPLQPPSRHAMDILLAELDLLRQNCQKYGIQLRLVIVPLFPPRFYETQTGTNWTLKIKNYDFLQPDREIASFAHEHDVPFLSIADWLTTHPTDTKEIQKYYLTEGSGHFSAAGHQMCATAMFETFYHQPKP